MLQSDVCLRISEEFSESSQTSKMKFFYNNSQPLETINYFCKKLYLRCLTELGIRLQDL